jgi:hypothetical protein
MPNAISFTVVKREGLGDALDRDRQPPTAFANFPLVRPLDLDRHLHRRRYPLTA